MLFEVTRSHAGEAICFRGARKTLLVTFASGSDSFADRHLGAYRGSKPFTRAEFFGRKSAGGLCTPILYTGDDF
jgi:hypothetical protein